MKKTIAWIMSLVCILVVFSGCGSSSSTSSSAAIETSVVSEASAPSTTDSQAQSGSDFPNKEITIIVPFKAGGGIDVNARMMQEWFSKKKGWTVVVENITGGSTITGAQAALNAKADGYTLFANNCISFLVPPMVYEAGYNPVEAFVSIGSNATVAQCLFSGAAHPDIVDFEGFVDYCKANPGKVTIGVAGLADVTGISTFALSKEYDLELELVPFDGAADISANLLGGHIDFGVFSASTGAAHVSEGTIHPLAETSGVDDNLFGTPTYTSLGHPNATVRFYRTLVAPAGVPEDVLQILRDAFAEMVANPDYIEAGIAINDPVVLPMNATEMQAQMELDYAKYGPLCEEMGLTS